MVSDQCSPIQGVIGEIYTCSTSYQQAQGLLYGFDMFFFTCLAYNKEEHQVIRLNVGKEPDYCEEGPGFQWARPEEHCYLEEFVSESTNNDPLIDISLYSHHLSA